MLGRPPRTSLESLENRKISSPDYKLNHDSLVISPQSCHYTKLS
jgi:hypothetical protein